MTTFQALSTIDCASQAMGRGKFSYNFEPAQKTCKVGIIDLAATAITGIEEHVKLQGKLLQFEEAGESSCKVDYITFCFKTLGKVP